MVNLDLSLAGAGVGPLTGIGGLLFFGAGVGSGICVHIESRKPRLVFVEGSILPIILRIVAVILALMRRPLGAGRELQRNRRCERATFVIDQHDLNRGIALAYRLAQLLRVKVRQALVEK
jgi:hypothetical protein